MGDWIVGRSAAFSVATAMVLSLVLAGYAIIPSCEAADTIIVSPNPSDGDYTTIQSAIDGAQPGDTIHVLAGTYSEVIVIEKPLSLISDDIDSVQIDGGSSESVVTITSSWVNMTSFSIYGSISVGSGVMAMGVAQINLTGNYMTHVGNGILLVDVSNSTFHGNTVYQSQLDGVRIQGGVNNTIGQNLFSQSDGFGLNVSSSSMNHIHHNSFMDNGARDDGSNSWNCTYPYGGNYWSDHISSDSMGGPDQDIPQPDGIVDIPYSNASLGTSVDHYPLMAVWPFTDVYPPVIGLISPTNGTVIDSGDPVLFDVWDMNLDSVSYSLDGHDMGEISSPYSINTSSWDAGTHILLLHANDTFDNERNISISYTVEGEELFVVSSTPEDSATNVSVGSSIFIEFSKPVDESTVERNYTVSPFFEHAWTLSGNGTVLEMNPSSNLSHDTHYNITLTSSIMSLDGVSLEQTSISFTTVLEVELEVSGTLLDVYGDPVAGARVLFNETLGTIFAETESGDDGEFNLTIPVREYNITVILEDEVIFGMEVFLEPPGPIDLGDLDTMWDPGPVEPFDPTIPLIIILILIALGILGYLGIRRRGKPRMPPIDERLPPVDLEIKRERPEPGPHETERMPPPPYPGTTGQGETPPTTPATRGKGKPCKEIIELAASREEVKSAGREAEEARQAVEEARRALEDAEAKAREAEERADKAKEELEGAREEYEREVVEPRKRGEDAEKRVQDIQRRLQDMRENIPGGEGISFERRPGWVEGGIGLGDMLKPISIWYRDRQTMNEHTRRLREIYYKEYKPLKQELEGARAEAEEARRAADEAEAGAQEMERGIQQLEGQLERGEREAESARQAVEEARRALEEAEAKAREAEESARQAEEQAERGREEARNCEECLQDVRDLLAEISALRERYENLKGGEGMSEVQEQLDDIDGEGTWDDWWDSFKRFRDKVKQMADIKGLTDAQIPSQFSGIWDWGGPAGTAVGYGAEDIAGAAIPTDTIKVVGELYRVFQALFDPNTALGARILMEQLGADDAPRAADAFNDFPKVLRDAIESFGKLEELRDLENEISSIIDGWSSCLDALPPVPEMPTVDIDALCLEQCKDKREELEELKKRLEELIDEAKDCRPEGLDDKFDDADDLKRDLRSIRTRMNRTREGLELYRRAHRQHFSSRGCFISTAAYGSPLAPELDTLRWFRDEVMSRSVFGRGLMKAYRRHSPGIAERLLTREEARRRVRSILGVSLMIVERRKGAGAVSGALLSMLAVLVYVCGSLSAWRLSRSPPRKMT